MMADAVHGVLDIAFKVGSAPHFAWHWSLVILITLLVATLTCIFVLISLGSCKSTAICRIRDSQVILLTSRARGCFHAAPYVDEFGETDFGFRFAFLFFYSLKHNLIT